MRKGRGGERDKGWKERDGEREIEKRWRKGDRKEMEKGR